jgi:hypothetical protein
LWYFVAVLLVLMALKVIYHIMLIERTCVYIKENYVAQG